VISGKKHVEEGKAVLAAKGKNSPGIEGELSQKKSQWEKHYRGRPEGEEGEPGSPDANTASIAFKSRGPHERSD